MNHKVIDNCHTCKSIFRNMEACPLYLWTGYEAPTLDVMFFYTLDMTMVISSLLPYFLTIIIMVLALGYRKNSLVCQTILIILQYVVCHALKATIKQKRPSRKQKVNSLVLERPFIWNAKPACFFYCDSRSLVHTKEIPHKL